MNPSTIMSIAMSIVALLQILLGALAMKAKPNSMLGLRLPWTMKNEKIWRVSQRLSFLTSVTTSIGIFIVCATVKNSPVLIFVLSIAFIVANVMAVSLWSYFLSQRDEYRS
ncbi:MAG TPA: SdpI family protein [Bacilli bacterium]|nr:SdpI family protein [Bacilli bacterium]